MKSLRRLPLLALALMLIPAWAPAPAIAGEAPGLTVVLVVDQLTADRTREWAHKPFILRLPAPMEWRRRVCKRRL